MWRCAGAVYALALGALAAPVLDEEMAELAKIVRDNCVDETGVDKALLAQVDGGADLMPDGKLKCYIKCTMEMAGMLDDGEVDVDTVVALLPPDIAQRNEPTLRGCGTQRGADDCDTAFLTQTCWQKSNKADYFLI